MRGGSWIWQFGLVLAGFALAAAALMVVASWVINGLQRRRYRQQVDRDLHEPLARNAAWLRTIREDEGQ